MTTWRFCEGDSKNLELRMGGFMTSGDNGPGSLRFAGAGLELAGAFLVFAGLGYWVDQYLGLERPWGMLAGGLLGFLAGMIRLFRLAMQSNR